MSKFIKVPEITLRVLSLNMQFAAGPENHEGTYMMHLPRNEIDYNLDQIVELIEEANPDLICLQEADLMSARTHFMNQPREIAHRLAKKKNKEPYQVVTGSCVDLDQDKLQQELERLKLGFLVPFTRRMYDDKRFAWLFNKFSLETGRLPPGKIKIHFGNAILARPGLPIKAVKHEFFFQPSAIPITYLNIMRRKDERKSYLRCLVDYHPEIPEKIPLYIINTHFENNDERNRRLQSKILYEKLNEIENNEEKKLQSRILYEKLNERSGAYKILAGDFNAVPLGPDAVLDSEEIDSSLERLLRHPNMKFWPDIYPQPGSDPQVPAGYATYPSEKPEQILDVIMASRFLEMTFYKVCPKRVSDHLAVVTDIKINQDLVPRSLLKQMIKP